MDRMNETKPQRFSYGHGGMDEDRLGEYVAHDSYAALQAQADKLETLLQLTIPELHLSLKQKVDAVLTEYRQFKENA